jgi:hypothetical protein
MIEMQADTATKYDYNLKFTQICVLHCTELQWMNDFLISISSFLVSLISFCLSL